MSDDDELFAAAMADVKPLAIPTKSSRTAPEPDPLALARRRQAASAEQLRDGNFLSGEYAPPLSAHDVVSYARPGVQHGVLKKLRLGKYQLDATLDLHRRSVEQARREVFEFIGQCLQYELRTVLITHGKGRQSEQRHAVLKSFLAQWLPQLEGVLAVHSAQPRHGGTGALYVLLKKGDKARLDNRERFARRP